MTEQTTTTAEGTDPRCRCGSKTDDPCPRPATTNVWGDGPPDICGYHAREWDLNNELGQLENSSEWLETYERQAGMLDLEPLTDALASVRERIDSEIAGLRREHAELEERERARG